jgi:hypothetical protein
MGRMADEEAQLSLRLFVIALIGRWDVGEPIPLLDLRNPTRIYIVVSGDPMQELTQADALLDDRNVRRFDAIGRRAAIAARLRDAGHYQFLG